MSTMYNLLHIPLCTVMLILIFNSTAYCHAHSFTFYILFFISYFSFILSYVYFPCVVFSIFALSMERTRLSFHCWLYSLCIVVYVTNKTWNLKLKLETWTWYGPCGAVQMSGAVLFRFCRINIKFNIYRTCFIEENYITIIIAIVLSPSPTSKYICSRASPVNFCAPLGRLLPRCRY